MENKGVGITVVGAAIIVAAIVAAVLLIGYLDRRAHPDKSQ